MAASVQAMVLPVRFMLSRSFVRVGRIVLPERPPGGKSLTRGSAENTQLGRDRRIAPSTFSRLPRLRRLLIRNAGGPPSEAQFEKLSRLGIRDRLPVNASKQDVSSLLGSVLDGPPTEAQIKMAEASGFVIEGIQQLTAAQLDDLLKLAFRGPQEEDIRTLKRYGLNFETGNGLGARFVVELIKQYKELDRDGVLEKRQIARACLVATNDPAHRKPAILYGRSGILKISWPDEKLAEWLRASRGQ
jgi:hypothetical protein